jgi:hypothetical protein
MRSSSSARRAASSTARGAGVPGWPTSRWITFSPAASRWFAARMTSIAINGGISPRREGLRFMPGNLLEMVAFDEGHSL